MRTLLIIAIIAVLALPALARQPAPTARGYDDVGHRASGKAVGQLNITKLIRHNVNVDNIKQKEHRSSKKEQRRSNAANMLNVTKLVRNNMVINKIDTADGNYNRATPKQLKDASRHESKKDDGSAAAMLNLTKMIHKGIVLHKFDDGAASKPEQKSDDNGSAEPNPSAAAMLNMTKMIHHNIVMHVQGVDGMESRKTNSAPKTNNMKADQRIRQVDATLKTAFNPVTQVKIDTAD